MSFEDQNLDLAARSVLHMTERERFERRMSWFIGEVYRQSGNRAAMAKCERYYDQEQIELARRREIEARGQTPVQFDMITPEIDWYLGTERRLRIDYKIVPRRSLDLSAQMDAENKSAIMKWIDDANRTGYERSACWDDAMKAGMGWLEVFARKDDGQYTVGKQSVPWRHILHDSLNTRRRVQDMRFLFRMKPVDLDVAIMHFPSKRQELMKCAANASALQDLQTWMSVPGAMIDLQTIFGRSEQDPESSMPLDLFNTRQRVLLVECWSLEPFYDASSASLNDPVRLRPMVSIMTEYDTILEAWSPYKHDRIPFVPYWAYLNKRTGLPYSPILRQLDKQDALNKAMSRALHDISVDQVHFTAAAIDEKVMTLEELRNELDDPGGMPIFAKGALQNGEVKIVKNTESAIAHGQFSDRLMASMQTSQSVNKISTGGGATAISGTALQQRDDQSQIRSAELWDNLVLAHEMEGELTLSTAEQFMNQPMVIPAKSPQGVPTMIQINTPRPDGSGFDNDITALKARYVIEETPWKSALSQSQFESFMLVLKDLAGPAPQVVVSLLDVAFQYADIPNKALVLERIRAVTGQQDPSQRPTPQQIQQQQRNQIIADAQFKKILAELQADIRVAGAKGDQLVADGWVKRLEALGLAATVAVQVASNPILTPVTDQILATIGFVDEHPAAGQTPGTMPADVPQLTQPATEPTMQPQPAKPPVPPRPAALPYPGAPA